MKRRLAGMFVVAVLGSVLAAGSPAHAGSDGEADGAGERDATTETLETVATCIRSSGALLVAFVIDESASLAENDPQFERVVAAQAALDSFRRLATPDGDGTPPTIEAFVATFARDFRPRSDWGDLAVEQDVEAIADAIDGVQSTPLLIDTDIPLALDGAQRELADRSALIGGDEPCKVVLLFTDGEYALVDGPGANRAESPPYAPNVDLAVPGSSGAAIAAGVEFLCDAGRLVDTLRNDGAVVLTAALVSDIAPADRDFLAAISTGASGEATCGSDSSPSYGAFLPAESAGDLVPIFDTIAQQAAGATTVEGDAVEGICVGEPCDEGRFSFTLEPGVAGFSSTSRFAQPGISVLVRAPDGSAATIEPSVGGSATLADSELRWEWIDESTVAIDARTPTVERESWSGAWSLTFIAPSVAATGTEPVTTLNLFGALEPALVGEPELTRAEPATITVEIVDETGTPTDPASLGVEAQVSFVVTDPTTGEALEVTPTQVEDDRWEAIVEVPADLTTTTVDLETQVRVTTAGGQVLALRAQVFPVPVQAAQRFPSIRPAELRPDSVRGAGSTTARISIVAGELDGACVWVASVEVGAAPTVVESVVDPDATSEATCLQLGPGEEGELTVRFVNAESSSGSVRGTVTTSIDAGEAGAETISIPFAFDLAPPINEAERVGLFLAIFAAGVVAPIAALVLLNRRFARFRARRTIRVARVPLLVERTITQILRVYAEGESAGTTVLRVRDERIDGTIIVPEDFRVVPAQGGTSIEVERLRFEARAPVNPFSEPFATVSSDGRPCRARVVGDERADESALPVALPSTWVVTPPTEDGLLVSGEYRGHSLPGAAERIWVRVDLTVFLVADDLAAQLVALAADLAARLSPVANSIADAVEEAAAVRSAR